MAFAENMEYLKQNFPEAWQKISETKETLNKNPVKLVSGKHGIMNMKAGRQYFFDRNDPFQEASQFIAGFENVQDHSDILFYGLGLGYHINAFIQRYPQTPFYIYEPVPEVFRNFLHHGDLAKMPSGLIRGIFIECNPEDLYHYCRSFINRIRSSALVIDLPAYKRVFPEKHRAFFTCFERQMNERRISLATSSMYQKRWTINSIKNFMRVLNTPNILLEYGGFFLNKPALLAASGPSLEDEIENLMTVKENGLAYIVSVGTALNALIKHGIHPDFACTYDPSEENQIVCQEVLKKGINTIPLVFGSTVGYETLEKYPGPQMHILNSQDSLAASYLKPGKETTGGYINDAATIAVIALQLLYKLGFNPVILVGQNLAYRDGRYYTAGATYHPAEVGEHNMQNAVLIKDVYGNTVPSNHNFLRMKQQLEFYLGSYQDLHVINTTRQGAHIEGTEFRSLEGLIAEQLREKVVEENWLLSRKCSYDTDYLIQQSRAMNDAYAVVGRLLQKCQQGLDNINLLAESKDAALIGHTYEMFNRCMEELRNNRFFSAIIEPMNRVELEFLILAVPDISRERDPVVKAQMMEKHFRPYLINSQKDIDTCGPLFKEMNQSIEQFYKNKSLEEKAARIKLLLVECDGILTDGTVCISARGEETRKFHYKDRAAILLLKEKGIDTVLIVPEDDQAIKNAADIMGINRVLSGNKNKITEEVRKLYDLDLSEVACIFTDVSDLKLPSPGALNLTVQNTGVKNGEEAGYVLPVKGGQGAVMEFYKIFMGD